MTAYEPQGSPRASDQDSPPHPPPPTGQVAPPQPTPAPVATNRRPVDRLADLRLQMRSLRKQIRILKAEDDLLRAGIIAGTTSTIGDDYAARVVTSERDVLDTATAIAALGRDVLEPFFIRRRTTTVRLRINKRR